MRNDTQKVTEHFHLIFSNKETKIIETAEAVLSSDECVLYLAVTNLSIVIAGHRRIHVAPDTLFLLTDHRIFLRQPGVFKPMIEDIPLGKVQSAESREDSENAGHLLFTASGKSYDIMLALSRELREEVLGALRRAMEGSNVCGQESVNHATENEDVPGQKAVAADTTANKRAGIQHKAKKTEAPDNTAKKITEAVLSTEESSRTIKKGSAQTDCAEHTPTDSAPNRAKPKNYRYFSHKECEYFPCHAGADPENFNCLFCYCPFYLLGDQCGGNFRYLSTGTKDCTDCLYPHLRENYNEITARYQDIKAAMPCPKKNSPG